MSQKDSALRFMHELQALTNRIHATRHIDEILLEISAEVCTVFNAERLTIYVANDTGNEMTSRVKTGLEGFKELRIPVNDRSIAGFVANHKQLVNIRDVYNSEELASYSPTLQFLQAVDKQTGFHAREMLAAPLLAELDGTLIGVVQLINNKQQQPFEVQTEEGIRLLSKTLAIALQQRQQQPFPFSPQHKYGGLVAANILTQAALQVALRESHRDKLDLEALLSDKCQVPLAALGQSLAGYFGVAYEAFRPDRIKSQDLLKHIKREYAAENQWLPVDEEKAGIIILTTDPELIRGSHTVAHVFPNKKAIYRVTTKTEFQQTLDLFFGEQSSDHNIDTLLSNMVDEEDAEPVSPEEISAAQDNELVKLVNQIIVEAYKTGVSDIHIEPSPGQEKTRIRFRRDGSLVHYKEVPASYRSPLVTRIKIMCDLDISEKRKPQDGKIKFKKYVPGYDIELRVATIPTQGGVEDVVMRILASGEPLPLDKLALSTRTITNLKTVIAKPYGLFFVCGPTGSGKTTTLHSILKHLNTPDTKIWTAEDPVEITQKGLRQVQVNNKAGLTFATIMKAFLRADPDIIMVGEMRDKETTSTGIEASLTGHLVLATLHTNSAPESIIRLLDMGMDPFNFPDALLGILAQRLAKRLCKCKEAYIADSAEIKSMLHEYSVELQQTTDWQKDPELALETVYKDWIAQFSNKEDAGTLGQFTLYRPQGCEACNHTGYKGRLGLHELLVGTDNIKKQIQEHARVAELLATALEEGMRTLKQDGIEKVLQGLTDMAQIRAVCIK
jgi:type II secretory ATPase GspE/PulE/Tfp pilus assembly ATPase PilB-like protein